MFLIDIKGFILSIDEALFCSYSDEAEVSVTGVDDTFEQHSDRIVKAFFDLPVKGDRGELVVE
jgi:hypothetical protein